MGCEHSERLTGLTTKCWDWLIVLMVDVYWPEAKGSASLPLRYLALTHSARSVLHPIVSPFTIPARAPPSSPHPPRPHVWATEAVTPSSRLRPARGVSQAS